MDRITIASGDFYFDWKSRDVLHRKNKLLVKCTRVERDHFDCVFNTVLACRPPE